MRAIKKLQKIPFPDTELQKNFMFYCVTDAGNLELLFKWFNDRWNLFVTFPDGTVREAGVYPNVTSWTGHTDYGLVFKTNLTNIDYESLFLTEIFLITWE